MLLRLGTYIKAHKAAALCALFSLTCYYIFAYHLERTNFSLLLSLFAILSFLYYVLVKKRSLSFPILAIIGVLFRLVFLVATPNLSQDFYRFIWDGELVSNFINPYLHTPNTLIAEKDLIIRNSQTLYKGMGALSAAHFSNYPPLNQLLFGISTVLGSGSFLGSIIGLRCFIILADLGILFFGQKLLRQLQLPNYTILWYFLNPLVIVELAGNLHFEGVMIFFFVWSIYLLAIQKWQWSAVAIAGSIAIKLVPLLFLPLYLKYFGFKKSILFYLIIGATLLLLFAPFYSPYFFTNYAETIGLWFSNFEFNAGFYNVLKYFATLCGIAPWELIKIYGAYSAGATVLVVLLVTFLRKNEQLPTLLSSMLYVLTFYYLLATTVHPWYIIFLVLLAVFTKHTYAYIWAALIPLSYFAYAQANFEEHLGILAIEYGVVLACLGFYFLNRFRNKPDFMKNL